jgi:lipoprotein-releasing system permease protein
MKRFPYHIAKRYLLAKKEAGFITVISMISIIGVTVGVAALVVVLSVFNGFSTLVTDILVGFDPHVRVHKTAAAAPEAMDSIKSFLLQRKDVAGVSSFVGGKGMLITNKTTKVANIRGLEPEHISSVSGLKEKIVAGNCDFANPSEKEIVLGFNLADRLGVGLDDTVYVVTATGAHDAVMNFIPPELHTFVVIGIYESNNKDYDGLYSFTSVETAKKIYKSPVVHGFDIRTASIDQSEGLQSSIIAEFAGRVKVHTWFDLHKDLYSVMLVERWTAFIILTLIIGVASFNLMGSLTMTVIEKTRDIGILKAMGARNDDIRLIFRMEGLIVGVAGSALGLLTGYLICLLQIHYQLFSLDSNVYIIPAIPIDMRISDFIVIPLATLALCYIASYFPSKRAALMLPAEAVRWE